MSFIVKNIDLGNLTSGKKEFEHDSGLKITIRSYFTPKYQKAYGLLTQRQQAEKEAIAAAKLDDEFFTTRITDDDSELTVDDMLIHAMAMYLIEDWNATDENEVALPITGENLKKVIIGIGDSQIIGWLTRCALEVGNDAANEADALKKKPSSVTSGKKTTKA